MNCTGHRDRMNLQLNSVLERNANYVFTSLRTGDSSDLEALARLSKDGSRLERNGTSHIGAVNFQLHLTLDGDAGQVFSDRKSERQVREGPERNSWFCITHSWNYCADSGHFGLEWNTH